MTISTRHRSLALVAALALIGVAAVFWHLAPEGSRQALEPEPPAPAVDTRELANLPDASSGSDSAATAGEAERRVADLPDEARPVEPEQPGYLVRVQNTAGVPYVGAHVALCDPGWTRSSFWIQTDNPTRRTDAQGIADFGAVRSNHSLVLVVMRGMAPRLEQRTTEHGEQRVTLTRNLSLEGRVWLDGAPPERSLKLEIVGFQDPSTNWCPAARLELSQHGLGDSRLSIETGAGGAFEAYGLSAGEVVTLRVPETLRLVNPTREEKPRDLELLLPRAGLSLELSSLSLLTGRIVSRDATVDTTSSTRHGAPVTIIYQLLRESGASIDGHLDTAVGESFEIPFSATDLVGAELRFSTRWFGGEELARRELKERLTGSRDLGDIVVGETERELAILVRDTPGAPIPGARAMVGGRVSRPAGEGGRIQLTARPGVRWLSVGAASYQLRRFELPEVPPDPLVVTLRSANRLRIVVFSPDGKPAQHIRVQLTLAGTLTDDLPEGNGEFAEVRGAVPFAGSWSSDWRTHYYELGAEGVLELSDLAPNEDLKVAIADRYEHTLAEATVQLGESETRELRFDLSHPPRDLDGRVVDHSGEPIVSARVSLGGFLHEARTGEDGRYLLEAVYDESPRLYVSADGFATRTVTGDELRRGEIVLEPARTIWIEVVDATGERTPASVQLLFEGTEPVGGATHSPGFYQFDRVPTRSATARATTDDGRSIEIPVGPFETEVRLILP